MAAYPEQRLDESAKAYHAACIYFGMGEENRGYRKVAQELRKSGTLIKRWMAQHDWTERARTYDAAIREEESQERTKRYLADLEDHRTRYQQAGRSLYSVAAKMLTRMNREVDTLELTPAALGILLRAFTTAGDMEAHALNLDDVLPKLTGDSHD